MTGTVRERAPGRWQAQVSWREGGRRRFSARTVAGGRAEAVAALALLAAEHGVDVDPVEEAPPDPWRCQAGEPRPYPVEQLLEAADATVATLAQRCGVPDRTLYRWCDQGLTEGQADELAVRAGLHPGEVWPSWWDEGPRCPRGEAATAPHADHAAAQPAHRFRFEQPAMPRA